jgi:hypothetical protein
MKTPVQPIDALSVGIEDGRGSRLWNSAECLRYCRTHTDLSSVVVVWSGNGWARLFIADALHIFEGRNLQQRRERLARLVAES